ncbi:MAG TPA: GNAT family N-acetyltransferase [Bacteroidales bacterium]|nr:GNAT family N-acetyltransferase [Bacteroidales bacterium]
MNKEAKIIACDFNNLLHTSGLVDLLNHYIMDKMGGAMPLDEKKGLQLIEGLKKHPSKLVLFAELEERLIGLAICFVNFATFTVKPFINIHDIVVLDKYRNKGVGRNLMEGIHQAAASMGCSKITLEVREDNLNAQYLYQSLGYRECTPRMYFWEKRLTDK